MHSHKSQSQKAFLLIATLFHLYIIDKMDKVEESEVGQICMSSRIVRNLWCTFSLVCSQLNHQVQSKNKKVHYNHFSANTQIIHLGDMFLDIHSRYIKTNFYFKI